MKQSIDQRITELEQLPVVKYWNLFSRKTSIEQERIISDYEAFLLLAKSSPAGQLYESGRKALKAGNFEELRQIVLVARTMLENNEYEKSPQPFDPRYIHNQSKVAEYRALIATRNASVPKGIVENLL